MKLSTRGRYGLKAMYELALNAGTPLSIKCIADKQDISESYLEQLMALLKKAGLVSSTRGAQGGYVLTGKPSETTIGEVLRALEGSTNITECLDEKHCGNECTCVNRPVFAKIQASIDSVLDTMTLEDMLKE